LEEIFLKTAVLLTKYITDDENEIEDINDTIKEHSVSDKAFDELFEWNNDYASYRNIGFYKNSDGKHICVTPRNEPDEYGVWTSDPIETEIFV
jgi:hypothetical protein